MGAKMPKVNKKQRDVSAAGLRAFCSRHSITYTDIAHRMGVSPQYISAALRSDITGKDVSREQRERIREVITDILWDRENHS